MTFSKRKVVIFFSFLIILFGLSAEGVFEHPRKVLVIQTEHFDILFSQESKNTAKLLADNADGLYEEAKENAGAKYDFRMPVIISPDSDVLSVNYTSSPYNRVIIFDSVPEEELTCYEDTLLSLFYREIFLAIAKSMRSPFQQFLSKTLLGPAYQPVALLNLPFSFIEGYGLVRETERSDNFSGIYNDGYFLQILSQAKLEGKFPSYFQASVVCDIYPGDDLIVAAGTGFAAYLMQTYGYEKYAELWAACGELHPFLTEGVFYEVYGTFLKNLWDEFEDSVPLPQNLETLNFLEKLSTNLVEKDTEGLYEHILYSPYGLVWYDGIRHEVNIRDFNSELKLRELLFFADDIDRMTLSPDGRYIAVSYVQIRTRDIFKKKVCWIYDLKNRKFLDFEFKLRDASIITLSNGENAIAGLNLDNKVPELQIYSLPATEIQEDSVLILKRSFERNTIPSSLVYGGAGKLVFLLNKNNQQFICKMNIDDNSETAFELLDSNGDNLTLREMRLVNTLKEKNRKVTSKDYVYTFQYAADEPGSFTRMGYFTVNDDFEMDKVLLQTSDMSGGVYYPVIHGSELYYCSKKLTHNELRTIPLSVLKYSEGSLVSSQVEAEEWKAPELLFTRNNLDEYELSRYSPLKYMFPLSFEPFLSVRDITVEDGAVKWPGLGATMVTNSDPFMNNKIVFSAGWTFLKMDFTKIINATSVREKQQELEESMWNKDKSVALFIENTSTPVDIKLGSLFKFNQYGEYDFKLLGGTSWQVPRGMNFSNINFDIQTVYTASTDYYDANLRNQFTSMRDWPDFDDAYELFNFSAGVSYSNIHQYGISPFEKFGFSVGARFNSVWDIYQLRLLDEDVIDEKGGKRPTRYGLTRSQVDFLEKDSVINITQLNLGYYASVEIPRLNPLKMKDGWILCLPTSINVEFLTKAGTSLETKMEVLLIGKEIHNGFPISKVYFGRFGIKGGYDLRLDYDTTEVNLPDIRKKEYTGEVLASSYLNDSLFAVFSLDLSSPIGVFSSNIFNLEAAVSYYPHTQEFVGKLSLSATF